PVSALEKNGSGFLVNGESFDAVVLSTDVVGARKIMETSKGFPAEVTGSFSRLVPGQRYAVLRIWADLDLRKTIPDFVITDRVRVLDAVSAVHRIELEAREWAEKNAGSVIELHCYAVPDEMSEEECRTALLSELEDFFPEVKGLRIRFEHFQLKRDFTAFHTGHYAARPRSATGVAGFYAAGDWVKLPFPAMLMEAACAAGLLAANGILKENGLRQTLVESVPLRGLMAGMPQPPGRRILYSQKS
ncbi:MAG: FAD-dependent oxidoreductase, partial [Spirochaetia bacterium]|nr:FAD-dependent oxidoreductase [Spirochaetia bacterium]